MNSTATPTPAPCPAADLARGLETILGRIAILLAAHFRFLDLLNIPLWGRFRRIHADIASILAKLAAGTLDPQAPAPPAATPATAVASGNNVSSAPANPIAPPVPAPRPRAPSPRSARGDNSDSSRTRRQLVVPPANPKAPPARRSAASAFPSPPSFSPPFAATVPKFAVAGRRVGTSILLRNHNNIGSFGPIGKQATPLG